MACQWVERNCQKWKRAHKNMKAYSVFPFPWLLPWYAMLITNTPEGVCFGSDRLAYSRPINFPRNLEKWKARLKYTRMHARAHTHITHYLFEDTGEILRQQVLESQIAEEKRRKVNQHSILWCLYSQGICKFVTEGWLVRNQTRAWETKMEFSDHYGAET